MAFKPIVLWPDSLLRTKCEPVAEVNDEIRTLVADMFDTMRQAKGAGLAAPQVGAPKRVIVVDVVYADAATKPVAMINPEIVSRSSAKEKFSEACLSLPNQSWDVERSATVVVEYQDEQGTKQRLEANGVLAVALQHEVDHLDGVVYVEHLSSLKRDLARRKALKFKRGIEVAQKRRDMEIGRLQAMGLFPPPAVKTEQEK